MILNFDDDLGPLHFEFCFVGFVLGGSLQEKKGLQALRLEVGLFEKLESVSEIKPCGKKLVNGEPDRQLADTGAKKIQIDLAEFDVLYHYVASVPWQAGTPGRKALDTINWLVRESKNGHGDS
jgi:hypothetical protein